MKSERIYRTAKKIFGFLLVQPGWHYGGGKTPKPEIINVALTINDELSDAGFTKTNAFLGVDGEIRVTAYHSSMYFEATIEPNEQITFLFEQNDVEIDYEENASLNKVRQYIGNLREKLWSSSASFIKATMIPTRDDSQALLLNHQVMAVESPSLMQSAFRKQTPAFVNILKNTTKASPGIPLFSGISTPKYFPKNVNLSSKQPKLATFATTTS
jgi:hypothetical protein